MSVRGGHSTIGALIAVSLAIAGFVRGTATPADTMLTVPEGFQVEKVAGPPLVNRPIVADFDHEGRLYVADSSGSNAKVEQQLAEKPHRIVRLEDTNDDGRFDTSVVFADNMMLPEGAMWFDGSLYVAAPPSIWKLTDLNDDGVADQREEWFQGKTLTGCANDLHGPYLGPDGWIYWTKGAFAEQTYDRPAKKPLVTRASHIFRRRPGRPLIESVMTGGMDNPVDVAFTATGERLLTATFQVHPELGRRDAVIHAVYGGVYGKPHNVLDGHARTGELMPELVPLGPAVPAGLTRYASRVFGDDYRDNFFAALFNLNKVTRFALDPHGATFTAREFDFLVSKSRDFHPTDVLEDADGSLLVIDTGAWYKLCCPTSQLAAAEALGAVYRVRRQGVGPVSDPRGRALGWASMKAAQMTKLLDDVRPAVQQRAIHELARLEGGAVPALDYHLRTSASAEARRNAVWALTRIDGADARTAVRSALDDRDASVRQTAIYSAGLWRDGAARLALVDALKSDLPAVRRAAGEALGRIGDARAVGDLVAAAGTPPIDRALEHALTYSLIEIASPETTATSGRRATASRAKRVALIALDQMDRGGLTSETIVPLLDVADPELNRTAWWIAGNHPEWGPLLARHFQERLATLKSPEDRDAVEEKLVQFGGNDAIQALLAETAGGAKVPALRVIALRAMARIRSKALPPAWTTALVDAVAAEDAEVARHAVSVVKAYPAAGPAADAVRQELLRVARDATRAGSLRLDALTAIPEGLPEVDATLWELLRTSLQPDQPVATRAAAASVIEKARLTEAQLSMLAGMLAGLGPLELPRLLPAFDNGADERLGLELVAAVRVSKGRASVRPDLLRPRLAKYPASVQAEGERLLASLDADAAGQAQRLQQLLTSLEGGDIRRGQAIFNSPQAACLSCHAIGYLGGRIGPDLTRIGEVRSERDLLEAIVFPSATFARGYEPVIVTTRSGEIHSGVIRRELRDEVILATGSEQETRVPRDDIADMQPGTVSVMPPGLDEQLTRQELADLLAFLKATRWGAN